MRSLFAAALALVLPACSSGPQQEEQAEQPPKEMVDSGAEAQQVSGAEAVQIRDYADLEQYGGQFIYVIGTFEVHPQHRGKHGLVRLPTGLVIYLPHIDQWYKGYDWYKFIGQKVFVGGKLHSYVESPIDGMVGPYMDEPTPLAGADRAGSTSAGRQTQASTK